VSVNDCTRTKMPWMFARPNQMPWMFAITNHRQDAVPPHMPWMFAVRAGHATRPRAVCAPVSRRLST
jgi:hypothetical protein